MPSTLWTRRGLLAAAPAPLALAGAPPANPLAGDWEGVLLAGPRKLRLAIHLVEAGGRMTATLDSPDQGAAGLAAANVDVSGPAVRITFPFGAFAGKLSDSGALLEGTWIQGTRTPLVLARAGSPAAKALAAASGPDAPPPIRPQVPKRPYPYGEQAVTFDNPKAPGVRLAGTLTLPQGAGPFPAVALISGSGPNTRDEVVADHPIFLVLADWLTRQGLAVLRYDKRGIGQSTGDYAHATSLDFASDAEAALGFLRQRPDIDQGRLGLIGHSEGGYIAPMVAAKDPKVAFLVLMAGPALPGADLLALQSRRIGQASGLGAAQLDAAEKANRALYAAVMSAKTSDEALAKARAVIAAAHPQAPPAMLDSMAKAAASDWLRFMLAHDPAPALRELRCPVLALNGSKDLQVPPDQNLPAMRAALARDPDATVMELPGLNHLFQTAVTGAPKEYGEITETISPAALKTISDWITARTTARP